MKHFAKIEEEAAPVTYDSTLSVTLSLSDWNDIQTRLYFYGHNLVELGHDAAAKKVRDLCSRLADQTDTALTAAADAEDAA